MKKNIETIVVFGATGTLGTYLVDELAHLGYQVVACARRNIGNSNSRGPSIRLISVDAVSKRGFELLPKSGVRGVVQITGAMPSRMSGYKPQTYIDVNITGTLNVLEYCRSIQSPVHVYMQSHSDVAGFWNSERPIPADAPRSINYKGDHAMYIISKNAAVDLTEHFHQEYCLRTVILRLPTIYCYTPINQMFVNGERRSIAYLQMIERAMKSEPLEIWGNPDVRKDMVYVKDFNQIVIGAIENASAQGIYNVGTGVGTSLDQQVKGIIEVFSPQGKPSPIAYRPDKPSQNGYIYDISKTRKDLGYTPKFPYLASLRDMKMEMQGSRFTDLEKADLTI